MIGIYKITNKINGKVYIGQSKDVEKRLNSHRSCSTNIHLNNSINKYGSSNFLFECIEECDVANLNDRERFYINMYESMNPDKGYNLTSGGERDAGWVHSEQSRKYMSELGKDRAASADYENPSNGSKLIHNGDITSRAKGNKLDELLASGWELGPSDKFIKSGSSKRTGSANGVYGKGYMFSGEKNHFFGKHHSPESIQKIKDNMPDTSKNWRGRHHTEESKQKMRGPRESLQGENNPNYGKRGKDCTMYGRKAIHKDDVEKRVRMSEVDYYLSNGWELGVCSKTLKKLSENGKRHMNKLLASDFDRSRFGGTRGKRVVNKDGQIKYISEDKLKNYLEDGWAIGRSPK